MESWLVKKKRTMGIRKPKSFFNNLPTELQTKIFCRLFLEDQSKAMCVSHQWRDSILSTTLPKKHPIQLFVVARNLLTPFIDLEQLFNWCSLIMCCRAKPKKLIGTCNGLLLFCHNDGEASNILRDVYYYYVLNPVTKQCVAVMKPTGQTSGGYSYAALAYDPTESWFFKIVRFQGLRHVNVFSSRTGLWTTLSINLSEHIHESNWIKKSIYLKGSIYRPCNSGYLVKIKVDPQENVSEQVEVIALHPNCLLDDYQWDVSSKDDKLLLILSRGVKLVIFELLECVTNNASSYTWEKMCSIKHAFLMPLNTSGKLLSFHPYHEVVYFKVGTLLHFYFYDLDDNHINIIDPGVVEYNKILYDYLKNCGHPMLNCSAPFVCCLDKKNSRDFQRLAVPH